jgi:SAM-dependent methyltransferase
MAVKRCCAPRVFLLQNAFPSLFHVTLELYYLRLEFAELEFRFALHKGYTDSEAYSEPSLQFEHWLNCKMSQQETATAFEQKWRPSYSEELLQPHVLERLETRKKLVFDCLDVGCGNGELARGTVNVDIFRKGQNLQVGEQLKGEHVNPRLIPNFVVADACHLPFRKGSFSMVFSSHVIEHVSNPLLMFAEMCRVAKRKVVVRCPHRRGSGAKRPFHVNYLDEAWFERTAESMGYKCDCFLSAFDYPISNRVPFPSQLRRSLPWRALRHFERRFINHKVGLPFEMEAWVNKMPGQPAFHSVYFITVCNDAALMLSHPEKRILIPNYAGRGLPALYNETAESLSSSPCWLVFCHQDFFLYKDLNPLLHGLDKSAVYGVIGARLGSNKFFGKVQQTDGSYIGVRLENPEPVQTVDEMCIIVHSSLFRKGLRFDDRFKFHFYGADFCLQAYSQGFDVKAVQVTCQHKSRTVRGDLDSAEYADSKRLFREKWKRFLPIRTTTTIVEK